jgi:NAD(P)-dependent dehydrogenase (short-subunit alcohol dehydrogenase family)
MPEARVKVDAPARLFSLDGKVVLLTGASSGLGARWVPVLAAAGAKIVMAARRETELLEVAATVPGSLPVVGDVTDEAHRVSLVETAVREFGCIDVLINNAGTAVSAPATEMTLTQFREMIDTDLTSLFALTQVVARTMIDAGRGSIINITSLGAERALDRYPLAAYSAAKAGAAALTRNLASEWGRYGVRVNAVGPAFFPTRLSGFMTDPEQVAWIEQHTALKRTARIDELDGTIIFLASDASSFITGQQFYVDGGWSVY